MKKERMKAEIQTVDLRGDTFEYGIVVYKHRFSITRSLDDYAETVLNKVIRMGIAYKYKTMACDKLIAVVEVLHRDVNGAVQCLCLDLHDYTFEIQHIGDMTCFL